ncbi:MAG TPA: penicillin-binding protein 2 [Mycobacteriales bacterium]|nr:penicillin-binding protein 2 [Mycobacteriales bacterium]
MSDRSRLRLVVLRVLVISLLATLLGRLWYLQVLAGPEYAKAAADNQTRDIITPAPRGEIVDDKGRAFAENETALVISVDRIKLLRQADDGEKVLHRLSRLLDVPYPTLHNRTQLCTGPNEPEDCWNGSPYEPIPVSQLDNDRASTRLALQILERKEDFPGVTAELAAVRHYPTPKGARATHVLGYVQPITAEDLKDLPKTERDARRRDLIGKQGLEQQYDKWLRGRAGVKRVAVDHIGAVTGIIDRTRAKPGDRLVTSLDADVQAALEHALTGAVRHARDLGVHAYGGPSDFAAGVVLDAQTGHIVAMASYPTYDPSLWDGGRISQKEYDRLYKADGSPLVDKAYSSAYSPGSTFKPISTAGLLHDGIASTSGYYNCGSSFSIGARSFRNFEGEALGAINLHTTLVKSCDTVYYQLAYQDWLRDERLIREDKKPIEGVQNMARDFGLGVSDDYLDLPNEVSGHIADRRNQLLTWKATKDDYCKGAKRRPAGDPIKAFDREYCTDGWRFNPGLQLIEDIGQGSVLVTPLQLAVAYAAVANGGKVFEPRVGKFIVSPSGRVVKRINAPVRGHLPIAKSQLDYIRDALYQVPRTGTAAGAFYGFPHHKVRVGGKTGTAELGLDRAYTSAWFASFAGLSSDPEARFVTVIMVDKGGVGGVVAAPAVRQVWEAVFGLDGKKAIYADGRPPSDVPPARTDRAREGNTGANADGSKSGKSDKAERTGKADDRQKNTAAPALAGLALLPALLVRRRRRTRRSP